MLQATQKDRQRRRVLVVAYYFPPMGLSGVQRVAKFVKYLPEYGWDPVVLTVEPAGYFAFDRSLLDEVERAGVDIHRVHSFDPTRLYGRQETVTFPEEGSRRWLSYVSQLLFIPDNKVGWLFPAWYRGRRLLREQSFDAIFSSAPPYTGHLAAALLSRWSGVPLVTDFRDDWVGNPRHVYPTVAHRWLQGVLERFVLQSSRRVLTINRHIAASLASRGAWHVSVLPHGYDAEDFAAPARRERAEVMTLVHSGIFYDAQTPDFFLRGLAECIRRAPEVRNHVRAVFVGLFPERSRRLAKDLGLADRVEVVGYVEHKHVPSYLQNADVLWMTVGRRPGAEGISTSKLFEYIGARKSILALVPPGAAKEVLEGYQAAVVVPPDDVEKIAGALAACYEQWKLDALPEPDPVFVESFDRRRLADELAGYLEAACKD